MRTLQTTQNITELHAEIAQAQVLQMMRDQLMREFAKQIEEDRVYKFEITHQVIYKIEENGLELPADKDTYFRHIKAGVQSAIYTRVITMRLTYEGKEKK